MLVCSMNVVQTNRTPKKEAKGWFGQIRKGLKCWTVLHINDKKSHYWARCPQLLVLWSLSKDSSVLPTLTESSLMSSHHVCAKLKYVHQFLSSWVWITFYIQMKRDQKTVMLQSCWWCVTHLPLWCCCCFHTCFFTLVLKLKSNFLHNILNKPQ